MVVRLFAHVCYACSILKARQSGWFYHIYFPYPVWMMRICIQNKECLWSLDIVRVSYTLKLHSHCLYIKVQWANYRRLKRTVLQSPPTRPANQLTRDWTTSFLHAIRAWCHPRGRSTSPEFDSHWMQVRSCWKLQKQLPGSRTNVTQDCGRFKLPHTCWVVCRLPSRQEISEPSTALWSCAHDDRSQHS